MNVTCGCTKSLDATHSLLGIGVASMATVVFQILGSLEVLSNTWLTVIFLGAFTAFQLVAIQLLYRHLTAKY